ncbi:protein kinase protein with tetratricopeptiderepeat domain [Striga asiatica]|uniref:Protein kinase protein with tetratricopeptiderepeat domain n=1 Tax=Striga asiatica TaxID=4170 RepID=A0A5A7RD36_STRAF|nr:protein kinase protein with tetratricopeptiderepeat domain [Striga asiatica]
MSPVSFETIDPLARSSLASMAPSRIALDTMHSASATGLEESSCSFEAISVSEMREYEMLMLRSAVRITLCLSRTIKLFVRSAAKVLVNRTITAHLLHWIRKPRAEAGAFRAA